VADAININLKIYKRGTTLYFPGISGENIFKSVLRNMVFDRIHRMWTTPATLTVFKDLWKDFRKYIAVTDAETRQWYTSCKNTIIRLSELQQGLKDDSRPVVLPDTIDYVLPPFQHQREAIAFALNIPKASLYLDLGMGKTYTSITIAKLRHTDEALGGIKKVLVILPRSLMYQWEQEVHRFAPDAVVYPVKGTPGQKNNILHNIDDSKFTFTLITYEGVDSASEWLQNAHFDMFILDEATKIKNPKAKRTLAAIDICNSIPYGLLLTGMPYVSNPLDLFAQCLAVDKTIYGTNQWVFSNRYIDYVSLPFGKVIKGFKHMDELKSRAYLAAFSRSKDQCLDLPPKVYQVRKLPIYEAQYEWYTNLLDQIDAVCTVQENIEQENTSPVTVEYVVSMLEKFQQITSGYITTDDGDFIWLDSPKYEEMLSIIRNSSDSFIIWARHTFILSKLQQYLHDHEIEATVLDRRVSDARRKTIKEQFKQGQIKVLILQIQSECRGNDFTCETNPVSSIFFENTASIEERSQAEDRHHRIGMKGTSVYIDLICEDTYDEGIKLLLENKQKISEYIRKKDLELLLGKGGSIGIKKTRSKKKPKSPVSISQDSQLDSTEDFLKSLDVI